MYIEPIQVNKNRFIGNGHPCFIIAEAGINHNGDINLAKKLIDLAKEAGADAVKFQTYNPDTLVTKKASKAKYQKTDDSDSETFYSMLKKLYLPKEAFQELSEHAKSRGIIFMSKAYMEFLDFLVGLGTPALKIDSASIIHLSYVKKIAEYNLPVIVSTGTSTLGEIEKALEVIHSTGNKKVVLLHCTTAYPTPIEEVNLNVMTTLKKSFGTHIGFSDHSEGIEMALASIPLGATVIEKHFTIDKNMEGPDHKASLEPQELKNLVDGVTKIQKGLGSFRKIPTPTEKENMKIVRRSLCAKKDIKAGEVFSEDLIDFKRPYNGLGEDMKEVIFKRVAAVDIEEGDPITWEVVGDLVK
ncbi:MAG: N-acetylneuraminate synthase [Leptospiraceae bacterium]|nr:N-acetylneuraminate synthase [Leptospiraceae bacterium]